MGSLGPHSPARQLGLWTKTSSLGVAGGGDGLFDSASNLAGLDNEKMSGEKTWSPQDTLCLVSVIMGLGNSPQYVPSADPRGPATHCLMGISSFNLSKTALRRKD